MKYRIMKIGDKYAAQLLDTELKNQYISKANGITWCTAGNVVEYCLHDTIEQAGETGDKYCEPYDLLEHATEVKK